MIVHDGLHSLDHRGKLQGVALFQHSSLAQEHWQKSVSPTVGETEAKGSQA